MRQKAFAVIVALLLGSILLFPNHAAAQTRPFLDIVLLFDHSYSMFEHQDGRLREAKAAAINFIEHLNLKYDRVGLVRFSGDAEVQKPLGAPFTDIKNKIQSYHLDPFSKFTDLQNAIEKGREEITGKRARANTQKFIVLLSDGGINRPMFGGKEDVPRAHSIAFDEAARTGEAGVEMHVVIIGTDPGDQEILREVAAVTGGKSYFAVSPLELIPIYNEIADDLTNEPLPAAPAKKNPSAAAAAPQNRQTYFPQRSGQTDSFAGAKEEREFTVPPVGILREGVWDGELPEEQPSESILGLLIISIAAVLIFIFFGGAIGFAASKYVTRAKE